MRWRPPPCWPSCSWPRSWPTPGGAPRRRLPPRHRGDAALQPGGGGVPVRLLPRWAERRLRRLLDADDVGAAGAARRDHLDAGGAVLGPLERGGRTVGYSAVVANLTGNPAMSVPLWWNDAAARRSACTCLGRFGAEGDAVSVWAGQLETARPWVGLVTRGGPAPLGRSTYSWQGHAVSLPRDLHRPATISASFRPRTGPRPEPRSGGPLNAAHLHHDVGPDPSPVCPPAAAPPPRARRCSTISEYSSGDRVTSSMLTSHSAMPLEARSLVEGADTARRRGNGHVRPPRIGGASATSAAIVTSSPSRCSPRA